MAVDFEVRRDDLRTTRVVGAADGNVRIDRFALTANNVTYGVMGDQLNYWSFFPSPDEGWGRIPVWGLAEVLDTGEWIYGYFPMSSHVTMQLDEKLFERSPHRADLPATYNRYMRMAPDTPRLDEMLLLRPLFGTSFLLADFLGDVSGSTVVLGSASSKTAYGTAFLLGGKAAGVVGLTSQRNRAFVESLGVYDRVLTYDDLDALRGEDVLFVDMSGDGAVRDALHATAKVGRSVAVGATHWEATRGTSDGGQFFFAPSHIETMAESLGQAELQRRMGEAWMALMGRVDGWMDIERGSGPDDLERVWGALVDGDVDPRAGHIVRLP